MGLQIVDRGTWIENEPAASSPNYQISNIGCHFPFPHFNVQGSLSSSPVTTDR
jgi:hypothetical protein